MKHLIFSYIDQGYRIAVLINGRLTGHIIRENVLWFYRVRGTKIDGFRFRTIGEAIADLEGAGDWVLPSPYHPVRPAADPKSSGVSSLPTG